MTDLYRRERYYIRISGEADKYEVCNEETGVVEYSDRSLPRCMVVADEFADFFERLTKQEAKEVHKESKSATIVSIVPQDRTE